MVPPPPTMEKFKDFSTTTLIPPSESMKIKNELEENNLKAAMLPPHECESGFTNEIGVTKE